MTENQKQRVMELTRHFSPRHTHTQVFKEFVLFFSDPSDLLNEDKIVSRALSHYYPLNKIPFHIRGSRSQRLTIAPDGSLVGLDSQ